MSKLIEKEYKNKSAIKYDCKKCNGESQKKIEQKLSDIRKVNDLDTINCDFSQTEMTFDKDSISEIEEQMEMWKYLSKLSISLHNDYSFFSQFIVKTNFYCQMFNSTMKSLGYISRGKEWYQAEKPEINVFVNIIYNYRFYSFLCDSMTSNSTKMTRCLFCGNEIIEGKCEICGFELKETVRTNEDETVGNYNEGTANNNKTYTRIETNKYVRNDDIKEDFTGKTLELNEDELFGKSNNSITKELSNKFLSTNVRNESCENEVNEINITNEGCWKPESIDDDFKRSARKSQNSSLKSSEQSSYWICDNCTFRNTDLNSMKCNVCESVRQLNEMSDTFIQSKTFYNNLLLKQDLDDVKHSICEPLRMADNEQESTPKTDYRETLKNNIIKRDKPSYITRNTKTGEKWICNSCTFLNPLSSKMCEICMTINVGIDVGRDLEVPEETWICRQCKTSNSFDRYKCSNCKESADFFNKWVCERCRFFNDKLANKCGACENKNPNIAKCSQCKEKLVYKFGKCIDCLQMNLFLPIETIRIGQLKLEKERIEKKEESIKLINEKETQKITKIISTDSVDLMEPKRCLNFIYCKGKVTNNNHFWCEKCKEKQWFCPNEDCETINYLNEYCKKCKLQKDSDVSNCKKVFVLKDNKPAQMWMCGLCYKYTFSKFHRCSNCKNQRDSPSNTKCICGWNNAPRHNKCENCGEIIKKK